MGTDPTKPNLASDVSANTFEFNEPILVSRNLIKTSVHLNFAKMTNSIEDRIKEQGDVVRKLKAEKAAKEVIQEEVAKLKALKLELPPAEPKPKPESKPNPPANPEMEAKVKEQGDHVRKLKAEKAAKEVIDEAVEKLKALKLEMNPPNPSQPQGGKLILKTAKGTRDYQPPQMAVRG